MVTFIILQVIVFSAVIYFLKKILYGDTENAVKRLGTVYEDMVQKQKDLTEKIEEGEKELQIKKEEAMAIAEKLTNQAMDDVRKKEDEILKKARGEAEEILAKAHASKETLRREMEVEASKKMIDFSMMLLGAAFDENLQALVHERYVQNFIVQAKQSDLASVDSSGQNFVIRSALPLKEGEKKEIQKVLYEKLASTNFKIEEMTDEKLIAGIALQIGSLVLDASFANALKDAADKAKEKQKATG